MLHPFTRQIVKRTIHELRTGGTEFGNELRDRIFCRAGHADSRPNAVTFGQSRNHLNALLKWQPIHTDSMLDWTCNVKQKRINPI
jgi:hypothetical protein